MQLTEAPLFLVTSDPGRALRRLGSSRRDVRVLDSTPVELSPGSTVLLSGDSLPELVAAAVAALSTTPGATAAVDLAHLPDLTALLDPALGYGVVAWERWGDLAVAVLGRDTGIALTDVDLAALSATFPHPAEAAADRARVNRERVAVRSEQLGRSRASRRAASERVTTTRAQLRTRTRERDRARRRANALESSREMRLGRQVAGLLARVPGGRRGLLAAGVLALVLLVVVAVLVALWPVVGLVVAAVLALLGVAGVGALHLLLAVRTARRGAPAPAPARAVRGPGRSGREAPQGPEAVDGASLLAHLQRVQIELGDVRSQLKVVRSHVERQPERTTITAAHTRAQLQATTQLFSMLAPEHRVPAMGGWAASPDLVLLLLDELRRVRPRVIVECGSGVSTLWLALAVRRYGLDTRIVSLDHDAHFGGLTTQTLREHGVDDIARVQHAPLVDVGLPGHESRWYDPSGWENLADIGMLIVDGPPTTTGPGARYPALPLLLDRLAPTATVVLDDMDRADEQDVVRRWTALSPEFTRLDVALEKGATLLRREA